MSETLVRVEAAAPAPVRAPLVIHDPDDFDDAFYLGCYPDVAKAVAARQWADAWTHYRLAGRRERRETKLLGFDEGFYLATYPLVAEELAAGLAADPSSHYLAFGKARGYLRHARAPRPDNAAAQPSRFGGFWPDGPNALDMIADRLDLNQISEEEAEQLRFWREHGYLIIRDAVPGDLVDRARAALDDAYSGRLPGQLFECGAVVGDRGASPWRPGMNDAPAKALDIHFRAPAIRDVIFAENVTRFLQLLFESRVLASQSLGFWRGSAQDGHQDGAYVAYTIPRNFAASWIALEDATPGAGELFYHDGSHVLPDFLYGDRFKSVHELMRLTNAEFPDAEITRFIDWLRDQTMRQGFAKKPFLPRKGDALIWHADLVHGGNPISSHATRKSVVAHYCPHRLVPLYFEQRPIRLHSHGPHRYASGLYFNDEPALAPAETGPA